MRAALDAELLAVHDRSYLDELQRFCEAGGGALDRDTDVSQRSFEVAVSAAGACVEAALFTAATGDPTFCLVRPPGHHALADRAMGFCLINNISVAAAAAISTGAARKVAIFDVDVHHGNGTQEVFWNDPNVLYLSIHQWPWYPGTGALDECGGPDARGTTVNIPLPAFATDSDYIRAVERIAAPVIRRFGPDLILMSAGFDAHDKDPLGLMRVSTAGFDSIFRSMRDLAMELTGKGPVGVLEGGYDLESLSASVVACVGAMSGAGPALGSNAPFSDRPTQAEGPTQASVHLAKIEDFHLRGRG